MGTAKFDDGTSDNPKFVQAGAAASWLWFCSVLFCRRALTDGFIPRERVAALVLGLRQPYQHAERLVAAGLWEHAEGGYRIHDFLDWNPSKADVEDYRQKDRARKQEQHRIRSGIPSGIRSDSVRNPTGLPYARGTRAGAKSESESESESERGKESARGRGDAAPRQKWDPAWFDECRQLHGGACNGRVQHALQVEIDRERARQAG